MSRPHRLPSDANGSAKRLRAAAGAAFLIALSANASIADNSDRPLFQRGLWRFDRTIVHLRGQPSDNSVLSKTELTRCVDPNVAMREVFSLPEVGNCHTSKPQIIANRYIFANRCDYMGPVRTEITAESEAAYTEVNLLTQGALPRREVVIASRLGDCVTDETLNSSAVSASRRGLARLQQPR